MSHHYFLDFFAYAEPVLCIVVLIFLGRNRLFKEYAYLAALLSVELLSVAIDLPILYFAHHGLSHLLAYNIYFYTYWVSFAVEALLWLMVVYSVYKLAMAPLQGLQKLGMLVFRWAAAIAAVVTIAMAFAPHANSHTMIIAVVTQLQQTASILTLCLILFVTFAIRPMGLSYRSRIFGVSLGMGIVSATSLVGSAWFSANPHFGGLLDTVTALGGFISVAMWATYFALPEPKRSIIMLPTTSPFLRWNQISLALGGSPGYVAVGSVSPEAFAGAELEMMRRASTATKMAEIKDISIAV